MKLPLTRDKYHTTVTCGGNSVGNSTENSLDKQKQNKDSLTKGYKKETGKTHERYNERKPTSIFPIDEITAPSQFKLRGS